MSQITQSRQTLQPLLGWHKVCTAFLAAFRIVPVKTVNADGERH